MVEIECYYNPEVSTYTGMEALDNISYASTVPGDANLDLITDVDDLEMTREKLLGRWVSYIFDVRYDDVIDIRDLVATRKHL